MPNFNKFIGMGNIVRDIDTRYSPSGTAVATSAIAINRKWKTEQGEDREEVCFVDWVAFGKTAETMAQYLKKGNPIFLEGRLVTQQWEDKQTGQKRSALKLTVERFQFIGQKEAAADGPPAPQPARPRMTAAPPNPEPDAGGYGDDDVPPF